MPDDLTVSAAIRIAGRWVARDLESETDGYNSDPEMRRAVNRLISIAQGKVVETAKKIVKGCR